MLAKYFSRPALFLVLPLLIMAVCFSAFCPIQAYAADFPEEAPSTVIDVSTVDEFLDAIGSDRMIRLADGVYNLTLASSYGQPVNNDCWYWDGGAEDAQLKIFGVRNLHILGSDTEHCSIVTEPRYANVLSFSSCERLNLEGLTIGHTVEPGFCTGGVLYFEGCNHISIGTCDLYGCGTLGIWANECRDLSVSGTVIRECSYGGMELYLCQDVLFTDGKILLCGVAEDSSPDDGWTGFNLIQAYSCSNVSIVNSEIRDNVVQVLFSSYATSGFRVMGCDIRSNTVGYRNIYDNEYGVQTVFEMGAAFDVSGEALCFSGCSFTDNLITTGWFSAEEGRSPYPVVNLDGNPLDPAAIIHMTREPVSAEALEALTPAADEEVPEAIEYGSEFPGSLNVVTVTTTDEFLAAINDHTVIRVETDLLDFSAASNYGVAGGEHYYWTETYDGPGLVISGVSGLYIIGQGRDLTLLQTAPRYADVISFEDCRDLYLVDLTAGHRSDIAGSCSGDVFEFISCRGAVISNCGLFGCGVNGIVAENCSGFTVSDTEIYECSWEGVQLYACENVQFERCSIHDCDSNTVSLSESRGILWDGRSLTNGTNFV